MNSSTASQKRPQAGSSSSRMWFAESSSTNSRARGSRRRGSGPPRSARRRRSRACSTSVGARTCAEQRYDVDRARISSRSPAFSGDVVLRQRSLNQSICSSVASGDEPRREDLAERRVVLAPSGARQLDDGAVLAARRRSSPRRRPAARVAAVEHQARDALRVPDGVGDATSRPPARCRAARTARSGAAAATTASRSVDPALEREIAHVPVGHPAAALVVADEAEVLGEEPDPVPPDRALPLVLEMRQPVGGLDQQRAGAGLGPGELDAVRGAQVTDSLPGGGGHLAVGTSVPGRLRPILVKPGRSPMVARSFRRIVCVLSLSAAVCVYQEWNEREETVIKRIAFFVYGVRGLRDLPGDVPLRDRLRRRLRRADARSTARRRCRSRRRSRSTWAARRSSPSSTA